MKLFVYLKCLVSNMKYCPVCGKLHNNEKYCSQKCQRKSTIRLAIEASKKIDRRGPNNPIYGNKEAARKISEALKGKPKTEEHKRKLRGPRPSIQGNKNPNYKPRVRIKCESCGKFFEVLPRLVNERRFCSLECYYKWNKGPNNPFYGRKHSEETRRKMSLNHANVSGKNNPNWKGGRRASSYRGKYWWFIRILRFYVDGFRCLWCHKEGDIKTLQAHEVIPFRNHKGSGLQYNIYNLITLCASCHCELEHRRSGYYDFDIAWNLMFVGIFNVEKKLYSNFPGYLDFDNPIVKESMRIARQVKTKDEVDKVIDVIKKYKNL